MKRRNVIRNIAAGSLLVSGVGSAGALNRGSESTMYKLQSDDDTFEVVETLDGDVGIEEDCDERGVCCVNYCCHCEATCDICYCRDTCGIPET